MTFQAQNGVSTPLILVFWTDSLLLGKLRYKWWWF